MKPKHTLVNADWPEIATSMDTVIYKAERRGGAIFIISSGENNVITADSLLKQLVTAKRWTSHYHRNNERCHQ
jgi:hypothetical protein